MKIIFWGLIIIGLVSCVQRLEIPAGDDTLVHQLYSRGITVEASNSDWWTVYAPDEMVPVLKRLAINVRKPIEPQVVQKKSMSELMSYYGLLSFCSRIEREYSDIAKSFTIGESIEKRKLIGIRLRTAPRAKKIKLIGNMHGDEVVGREILIKLIEDMAKTKDHSIFDHAEVHILPSMNPDGFQRLRRTNAYGYDLNRNFPDRFYGQITPLQPETRAVMSWSLRENFTLSANFHGGDLVVNYPFDGNSQRRSGIAAPTKDDSFFKKLAHVYASNHPDMVKSSRFPGGITNGAQWYVLYGGMQDWNYLNTNDKELTIEVSLKKVPRSLAGYWEKNRKSLYEFMKQVIFI